MQKDKVESAKWLIKKGADLNLAAKVVLNTVTFYSILADRVNNNSQSFPLQGGIGWNPLMAAAYKGNLRMVELLLNQPGIEVGIRDKVRSKLFIEGRADASAPQ